MKTGILFFITICLSLVVVPLAMAHPGGGPPFLKVNGVIANTNPYSPLQEDNAPGKYIVGQNIEFRIDSKALGVPQEIVDRSKFRWSFEQGDTNYSYGISASHIYMDARTHIATLDVLAPDTTEYMNLDTVLINVVPDKNYQLPSVDISVQVPNLTSTTKAQFHAITISPHIQISRYVWSFGDGSNDVTGESANHFYHGTDFAYLVSLKATDSKKYIVYSGIIAGANKGKLYFENPYNKNAKVTVTVGEANNQVSSWLPFGIVFIVLGVVLIAISFVFLRKK